MAPNTSSTPPGQAPVDAQPSEPRTSEPPQPPCQALYGTPLRAYQPYNTPSTGPVPGLEPLLVPPRS
jgi:hypothetical protein